MEATDFNRLVANIAETHRKAVESALDLGRMAVRAQGSIARQQVAVLENCLEAGSEQAELAAKARDPRELLADQAAVATRLGEKLFDAAREALDIQARTRQDLETWMEAHATLDGAEPASKAKTKPASRARTVKKAA